MPLIQKPFDDSGVEMVDTLASIGTAITQQTLSSSVAGSIYNRLDQPCANLAIAQAMCALLKELLEVNGLQNQVRHFAQLARTLAFECESPLPKPASARTTTKTSRAHPQDIDNLAAEIRAIVCRPDIVPQDGSIATTTVLSAVVWSAVTFASGALATNEARRWVADSLGAAGTSVLQ